MRVRVFKPTKSAAQSGRAKSDQWVIEPELLTARSPEPIMGWASSGDTLGELKGRLRFSSLEDAMAFAKHKGWEAIVELPAERHINPRNYLDNFRIVRPEDEEMA
jgi:hypothetical protein